MRSIRIATKGYWPLPRFSRIHSGGWARLEAKALGPKEADYAFSSRRPLSPAMIILEAEITHALPKKIIASAGRRRFVLSRWIGGLYSNANGRSLSSLRAFYDAIAPRYRYHVEPERLRQLSALADALRPLLPPGARILDASAGDCTFVRAASPGFEVWCNDISPKMLALRPKSVPPSRVFVSSASRLPFPPSSFDALIHTFSNSHSLDRRFFGSFFRVLKAGAPLLYHPVKAPGEQWPKDFPQKTFASLHAAGFQRAARHVAHSTGKKSSTLVFYIAYR